MSGLSALDENNLPPDARAFLDALNGGPRGKIGLIGPFGVKLTSRMTDPFP